MYRLHIWLSALSARLYVQTLKHLTNRPLELSWNCLCTPCQIFTVLQSSTQGPFPPLHPLQILPHLKSMVCTTQMTFTIHHLALLATYFLFYYPLPIGTKELYMLSYSYSTYSKVLKENISIELRHYLRYFHSTSD